MREYIQFLEVRDKEHNAALVEFIDDATVMRLLSRLIQTSTGKLKLDAISTWSRLETLRRERESLPSLGTLKEYLRNLEHRDLDRRVREVLATMSDAKIHQLREQARA